MRLALDDTGHVTSVRGDPDDPFSKGYICPKGASLGHIDEDPDRLRLPMIRTADGFQEATWDDAFGVVDQGLRDAIERHGRQSLAIYLGNPTFHTMGGILYRVPLAQSLGTPNVYSASTIDQMPKQVACGHLLGNPMAIAVPDLDRTDYLLIIGANPAVSNGSLCAAPDYPARLRALRGRGGRLVVIDPRRTLTAELADEHLFVRPGTDAYLLLGIVHTLLAEHLATVRVEADGLDELSRLAALPPEAVEQVCAVPAPTVVRLAHELAAAPTAAVYSRIGTSTAEFGTLTQWLVDVVNILTGNFDSPCGVMFTTPACFEFYRAAEPFTSGRWRSRVRGMPEVLGELPVATLADEIETPGAGQVRAMVTVAGNPVLSAPNGPRLDRALAQLDFMVSVDPYLNETTKHATVILPPPRVLQMPHYDFLLLIVTVRNYARFSPPVLPLAPGQPSEADIMARLALIAAGLGPDVPTAVFDEQILDGLLAAAGQALGLADRRPGPGPATGRPVRRQRARTAAGRPAEARSL